MRIRVLVSRYVNHQIVQNWQKEQADVPPDHL